MTKITFLLAAILQLFISGVLLSQDFVVKSPCPENGVPVTKIEGLLTAESPVKRNPVEGVDCTSSAEKTAYAEHFIIKGIQNNISVRLTGENVRLDVYNRDYSPGEPCSNRIMSWLPSDLDTLDNVAAYPLLIFVISATTPVTDSLKYEIEFNTEVGLVPDKCLFTCAQKSEVQNLSFPSEPLDIQIAGSYQLKESVFFVDHGCSLWAVKTHKINTPDTSFSVFSTYFLRPELIEINFDLNLLELDCSLSDFSLRGILEHLKMTYASEELAEFSRLVDLLTLNGCVSNQINTTYQFTDLDKLNRMETDTFALTYGIVNWCAGKVALGKQSFILKRSGQTEAGFSFITTAVASPLTCTSKFTFPDPQNYGFTGCLGEDVYYTLEGDAPVIKTDNLYEAELSPGVYHFTYTIFSCCDTVSVENDVTITVLEPFITYGSPQPVYLNNPVTVLPGLLFTNLISDPCYLIKTEIVNSSSVCSNISNNQVTMCCDDLIYRNDTTVAQGTVSLEIYKIRDTNRDGQIGNAGDDTTTIVFDVEIFDQIQGILCPSDIILPCTTTDLRPEVTGLANVVATCFSSYQPLYKDEITYIQADKSLVTRTFEFYGYQSVHRCQQKIELDCTVSSEDTETGKHRPEVSPNPFHESPVISFWSDAESITRFSVLNDKGQRISTFEANITAGKNSVQMPASLFQNTGIYFADFMVNGKQHTARLVKIE